MRYGRWVVHIHGYQSSGYEWIGYLYVPTRESGRILCRALKAAGASGFVTKAA